MKRQNIILSKQVRNGEQWSAMPMAVGLIHQYGARNMIGAVGFPQALVLLSALIATQVYLIVARIQRDINGVQ